MSASTGTIQRPMPGGSILGAIAIGVATLFAVGALAWGAVNLTATKHVAAPVAAPTYLERGGRDLPQAAPMPYSPGKVGNVTPRFDTSATDSAALGGYFNAIAGGGHAAPLLDRNAENVVVQQRGLGKHAE
jgi:hypothetical protein